MKKIILILFLIVNISCDQKAIPNKIDKNHPVSDIEIYNFLNFVLKEQAKFITKCRNENVVKLIKENSELQKLFNEKDLAFIKKQTENEKNFKINSEYLNDVKVVSEKNIESLFAESKNVNVFWEKFEKEYGTKSFFSISLPIFSLDKKIAIINTEFLSNELFGYSGTEIYIKLNGEWKIYKRYMSSIS